MENHAVEKPRAGDVKTCVACGQFTAVYTQIPNSMDAPDAESAYPGRLPDIYAWACTHCGHEEREPPALPDAPA